jgi:hypothetical protein
MIELRSKVWPKFSTYHLVHAKEGKPFAVRPEAKESNYDIVGTIVQK